MTPEEYTREAFRTRSPHFSTGNIAPQELYDATRVAAEAGALAKAAKKRVFGMLFTGVTCTGSDGLTLEMYANEIASRNSLDIDAIRSRCLATIAYDKPDAASLAKIWRVLATALKADITDKEITKIVQRFPALVGRDVKNLIKLSILNSATNTVTANSVAAVHKFHVGKLSGKLT